jgi:uncharacterized protein YndB with AHSA1/START domain
MRGVVEKSLELRAAPERVWDALTDPAELSRWFPDRTDLEPRAGATGWFDWTEHGRYAVRVEEIDPPKRLVWTWARMPGIAIDEAQRTTVEWTLDPRPDGGTTLRVRESGFVSAEQRAGNDEGWDKELAELLALLGEPTGVTR